MRKQTLTIASIGLAILMVFTIISSAMGQFILTVPDTADIAFTDTLAFVSPDRTLFRTPKMLILQTPGSGAGSQIGRSGAGTVAIANADPVFQIGISGDGSFAIANDWTVFSDKRYKKNIRPIENALDLTTAMEGVRFNWKKNGKASIGFIAQDVEKVLPEIVHTDEAGYKSVDYSKVVTVLVEAVKEQQKIFAEQKAELKAMKNKMVELDAMKATMAQIESALQRLQTLTAKNRDEMQVTGEVAVNLN